MRETGGRDCVSSVAAAPGLDNALKKMWGLSTPGSSAVLKLRQNGPIKKSKGLAVTLSGSWYGHCIGFLRQNAKKRRRP